ncbi:MAG: hypothetical protein JSR95_07130 [Proteobacteria bacterium]|nr:hypothetical protein [Pseudomonadota bacterium]
MGGLPEHMKLKLIEPLRELFKDEVRKLGLDLGAHGRWKQIDSVQLIGKDAR